MVSASSAAWCRALPPSVAPSSSPGASGADAPAPCAVQNAASAAADPERACSARSSAQRRKEVVFGGSARPAYAASRSVRRTPSDTASTTRWWATVRRRRRSPISKSVQRTSGPCARSSERRTPAARAVKAASRSSGDTVDRSTRSIPTGSPGGAISWRHAPSTRRRRARSRSWCASTAAAACSSAARSTAAGVSTTSASVKWRGSGESCSSHQRCTGVSGTSPVTGPCSARAAGAVPATAASRATVWCTKSCLGVRRTPSCAARAMIWMVRIESPPSSKKLSCTPTRSSRSASAQTAASTRSVSVRGATYSSSAGPPAAGAGRPRRSTFPLGVSGISPTDR